MQLPRHSFPLKVDTARDHDGFIAHVLDDGSLSEEYSAAIDARKTGRLKAACACGWSSDTEWDNDAKTATMWPSAKLTDRILNLWRTHVHENLTAQRAKHLRHLEMLMARLSESHRDGSVDQNNLDVLTADLATALDLTKRIRALPA